MKIIYLAGGSFWAMQKYFDLIFGVIKTEVGYINGKTTITNYLKLNKTNHAECIKIIYNQNILSLEKLLEYYYDVINPTTLNKQGKDQGKQYRSGIYYIDKKDVYIIIKSLENLQKKYSNKIVVEVEKVKNYIKAEGYHQNFLKNNPFGYSSIPLEKYQKVKIKQLDNLSYRVMKYKETEEAFNNEYYNNFKKGIYVDKETNRPLFLSTDKIDLNYGWPTFSKCFFEDNIIRHFELKNLKLQNEILSKDKNHLGYLKDNIYIINSAALRFIPIDKMHEEGFSKYIENIDKF